MNSRFAAFVFWFAAAVPQFASAAAVLFTQTLPDSGLPAGILKIASDSQGNLYVAALAPSGTQPNVQLQSTIAKLRPDGTPAWIRSLPAGIANSIQAIAVDGMGNVWVAGSTSSSAFPVTPGALQKTLNIGTCPIAGNPAVPCADGFIYALSAAGDAVIYSSFIGGSGGDGVSGLAFAADGTLWVAGTTSSPDFPLSANPFQAKLSGPRDAFLLHFDPNTAQILYSTYFGGSGSETAVAAATDSQGGVWIGGETDSADLPITSGAVQQAYGGGTDVFLARFTAQNPSLTYATWRGNSNGDLLNALAADAAGNIYAAVENAQNPISLSPGAIVIANPRATVLKIDSFGREVWSNQLLAFVSSIAVDAQGRLSAGGNGPPGVPLTPDALNTCPSPGSSFLVQLEADGKTIRYASGAPGSLLAQDPGGALFVAGGNQIQKLDLSASSPMAANCILGFSQHFGDAIAPGEIVSIYGRNLGPAQGVTAGFDASGHLPVTLGNVTVTFDGAPAPLLYAQAGQINAIVPFREAGLKSASVQVAYNGRIAPGVRVPLRDASNIAITQDGNLIAAINEDGTLNSKAHPAAPGSVLTIYTSGGGQTVPASFDGMLATAALPLMLPVKILIGSSLPLTSAQVLYAGSAPGLVNGTVQINFRVPANLLPGPVSPGNPNQNIAILIGGDQVSFSTSGSVFVR